MLSTKPAAPPHPPSVAASPKTGPEPSTGWRPSRRLAQKRPAALALAAALAIAGGLATYAGVSNSSDLREVVVVNTELARGEVIEAGDLTTMTVSGGSSTGVPAEDAPSLVGQVVLSDLQPGAMVLASGVAAALPVAEDTSVVGVGVKSAQLPTRQLRAGDTVRVVHVPVQGAAHAATQDTAPIPGTVDATRPDENQGMIIVDVIVDSRQASTLAQWSSAGTAAIVLDPLEHKG